MKIENRYTGAVIIEGDYNNHLEAIAACIAQGKSLSDADLRGAYLSGAYLSGAYLSDACLIGADLRDAYLSGACLRGADLRGADLRDAYLSGANLSGAYLSGANLSGANLSGANLSGANLSGANLSGANLSDADLRGADLRGANLTPVRDDIWAVLSSAPAEVPALMQALKDGKVNGSTYEGECACLVGTIAKSAGTTVESIPSLRPNASRPAERFFLGIKTGDTPETNQFSALAVEWCEEWLTRMQTAFAPVA